jgi:NAD dependent epimerase/dehydratase family enzyme
LFLRVPAAVVRLAGEFSEELLDSKKVLPGVAGARGFRWEYPELEAALKLECGG